jgi:DeoD family purine-nucleoside phosphorylase
VESSRGSVSLAPIHLRPVGALAERVLLPGDPARALLLAQTLLENPLMFNHHRGLWGYTGLACDGQPLTIQSTGMGGPSAAIVISELVDLGARRLIRVGTCGGLSDGLALGDLVVVTAALSFDGTSRALCTQGELRPDPDLLGALRAAGGEGTHEGPVASTDLFYDTPPDKRERWLAGGALAVEMETATLFALAGRRSVRAASLLLVSDLVSPERVRISDDALQAGERRLGEAALGALLD